MLMSNYALELNRVSNLFDSLQQKLINHPLYCAIRNEEHLRIFMEHHVFAVWNFMSLIKSVQSLIAPTTIPWVPSDHPCYVHFINKLVSEEESDNMYSSCVQNHPLSHFESYLEAMTEVGANTYVISRFINTLRDDGLDAALKIPKIPNAAKLFMTFTFDIIKRNQPHLIVAVLALGRENLVPQLFRSLQKNLLICQTETPNLFAYLDRHIQLDEQEHAPIAKQLHRELCGNSKIKQTSSYIFSYVRIRSFFLLFSLSQIHKAILIMEKINAKLIFHSDVISISF